MTSVVPPGDNVSGTLYIRSPSDSMFAAVDVVSKVYSLRALGKCRGPLDT